MYAFEWDRTIIYKIKLKISSTIIDIFNLELKSLYYWHRRSSAFGLRFPYESSVEIETNDSLMVQGQDYKVDASKLSYQVLSIFDGSPKMCGVCRGRCCDRRRRFSYWSILVAFSWLLSVIFPVVDSRN